MNGSACPAERLGDAIRIQFSGSGETAGQASGYRITGAQDAPDLFFDERLSVLYDEDLIRSGGKGADLSGREGVLGNFQDGNIFRKILQDVVVSDSRGDDTESPPSGEAERVVG